VRGALGAIVDVGQYRTARRAAEVMRGLLQELPIVLRVVVEVEAGGSVAVVVVVRADSDDIVRACVPMSVNGVRVYVRRA
jgi:hypothetical protein